MTETGAAFNKLPEPRCISGAGFARTDWRSETCGTCEFWRRIRETKQDLTRPGYLPAWEPEGSCLRYPRNEGKDSDFAACAEWKKREAE